METFEDILSQRTLQCGYGGTAYNDEVRCYPMTEDDRTFPQSKELGGFETPFFTQDYLLVGSSEIDNCQCNEHLITFCIP